MSDEHVIAMLRGAAPHDGPPPTAGNIEAAAARGRRMRRSRRVAAATGSTLTVGGFVALLSLAGPSGQSVVQGAAPASTPTTGGELAPKEQNLEPPSSTVIPATAWLASGKGVPQCTDSQLRISLGPRVSEATQQETYEFALRNDGASACKLRGFPSVVLLDAQGKSLPFVYRHKGDQMLTAGAASTVVIAPGGTAYAAINKNACTAHASDYATTIELTLPSTATARIVRIAHSGQYGLDWCGRVDPGGRVTVAPIEPTEQALQQTH
jgi:hypothetical protein